MTCTVSDPIRLPSMPVIVAEPWAAPWASPPPVTDATLGFEVPHLVKLVTSRVV